MKKYIPKKIEPKWQKRWEDSNIYGSRLGEPNPYYVLAEFAYPSGDLHMGHWFTFGGADIFTRMKRMQGLNVFFPNGYDAFGLPAENAAIKRNINPKEWIMANIEGMRRQFDSMGASFSFDHQVITCDPSYYKWNQWIFLRMLEKGIAYRGKSFSKWCPSCQTVLADEQVVAGECERCGSEVEEKEIDQWFLKITDYADRLVWSENPSVDWPKSVMEGQNNWIGRSEGMEIEFPIVIPESEASRESINNDSLIKVYTVFPETIFGVTYMILAPEHRLVKNLITPEHKKEAEEYVKSSQKKSELERKSLDKGKTGIFTGSFCINPVNGRKVPIWMADYVIAGYGTGAVMGVPGSDHRDFEFAKIYDLEIIRVIGKDSSDTGEVIKEEDVLEEGVLVNSEEFDGLKTPEVAREKIKDFLEKKGWGKKEIQYHLHDWSISRQRYWGTPIPIIHCPNCGIVPVPDTDLPVKLPAKVEFKPTGKSPLISALDWVNVKCPKCSGQAKRETDTMDGFFDNSWYFFRYLDPKNNNEIFNKELTKKWLPLEIYFGGSEHTLGHTLYSRFFIKFFKDIGLVLFDEYAKRRVNHGIVLGPDGEKMSKRRPGSVVNPDDEVKIYGADTIRIHMAFFMPYEETGPWVSDRVSGSYRFLQRVWSLSEKISASKGEAFRAEDLRIMHKTIKKVTGDIENIKFNTAIASLMEWLNYLSKKSLESRASSLEYKTFLLLLAPFAPHITEELWSSLGEKYSIHQQAWPKFDNKYLEEEELKIVVQVNGKVRDTFLIQKDMEDDKGVVENLALSLEKVKKFLGANSVKRSVYIKGKLINFTY